MNKEQLKQINQEQVLRFYEKLNPAEKTSLDEQISKLDIASIQRMGKILCEKGNAPETKEKPIPAPVEELNDPLAKISAKARGAEELRLGRVAVVLVAGGQGSRLGFDGPKGAYKIGPVSDQPLFYFHARKILALSKRYNASVPFYIMTSETNDAATRECFKQNAYFGLNPKDVFFFCQGMWPALDANGKIILDTPSHIFMSPDGHGGILSALKNSGATNDMENRGITTVFYFQVDNPMVAIADPEFIGLHLQKKADISVKVCAKRDPYEGLGMVVCRQGKYEMVEYTELSDEEKCRTTPSGDLYYKFGSVAIHIFDFKFLVKEADAALPLHLAHKKIAYCLDDGSIVKPGEPNGYKFEKFVFDVLPDAENVLNLAFDRSNEFSPVKNATGNDSPETCKRDLQAKWAGWFEECGIKIPRNEKGEPAILIEIDPSTADSAEALSNYLCGKTIDVTTTINI